MKPLGEILMWREPADETTSVEDVVNSHSSELDDDIYPRLNIVEEQLTELRAFRANVSNWSAYYLIVLGLWTARLLINDVPELLRVLGWL